MADSTTNQQDARHIPDTGPPAIPVQPPEASTGTTSCTWAAGVASECARWVAWAAENTESGNPMDAQEAMRDAAAGWGGPR